MSQSEQARFQHRLDSSPKDAIPNSLSRAQNILELIPAGSRASLNVSNAAWAAELELQDVNELLDEYWQGDASQATWTAGGLSEP